MSTIKMLSNSEKSKIRDDLEQYATLDEDGSLLPYLTEMDVADGDVELRFFATPETGPVEGIYFEVGVYDSASWKVDGLGSYSKDNLRNGESQGSPHYKQLAEELESIVEDVTGESPDFVIEKGGGAFTAEVSV